MSQQSRRYNLTRDEEVELRELFNLVDRDESGTISVDELKQLMRTLQINATNHEIELMATEMCSNDIAAAGSSSGGGVTFEAFVTVMNSKVNSLYTPEQVVHAFEQFVGNDKKSTAPAGSINLNELRSVLEKYGSDKCKLSKEQIEDLMQQLDTDESGNFNYKQYVDTILS